MPDPIPNPNARQRLAEAEEQLHLLQTGRLPVEMKFDGREVRNNRVTVDELVGYIAELRDQIAGRPVRRGAIGITFG